MCVISEPESLKEAVVHSSLSFPPLVGALWIVEQQDGMILSHETLCGRPPPGSNLLNRFFQEW